METIKFKTCETIPQLFDVYRNIENDILYPEFNHWFYNKVIPRVLLGQDHVIKAMKGNEIIGISILKNAEEKKLSALRIFNKFQKRGYSMHLIDESLRILGTDKPLCSVSENLIHDYSRIFINRYNFDMTYVHNGLYHRGVLEYQFNGNKYSLRNKNLPY